MLKFPLKTKSEIIRRYSQLHDRVISSLTDHYNHFLGLRQMAYGSSEQRRNCLDILAKEKLRRKEIAFPLPENLDDIARKAKIPLIDFSSADEAHLLELTVLINYANSLANERGLTRRRCQKVYSFLIPFLYGKRDPEEVKNS